MQGHRICVILALTWLFCSGSQADEETRLPCDDPDVQKVVASVLLSFNKGLTEGNQLALYQIYKAAKTQNESSKVLTLEFTARESDCAAGEDKDWQECNYLRDSTKLLRHCHAKVLLKETNEILSHQCSVNCGIIWAQSDFTLHRNDYDQMLERVERPHIAEPRPPCVGCPEDISVDTDDSKESLNHAISKANLQNEHTHHFLFNSIAIATRQVIAGFRYKFWFDMKKSNCSKEEFKEITDDCSHDTTELVFINCNSTVDVAPWRNELPDTTVKCEPGPLPEPRRRPAGWSPLRTANQKQIKPKKEESSEELQEGKTPDSTTDPKLSAPPTTATSITCPSKPWKDFVSLPLQRPPPSRPRPDSNDKLQAELASELADLISK